MTGPQARPITILIAALGGEGGGVLTDWIVAAASQLGFPVQSTSIPGVAQRTGATTYYIEIVPVPARQLGGKHPILALAPGRRRCRHRAGERADGSRPRHRRGLRHARPHLDGRLDRALVSRCRADGDGRRALRQRAARQGDRGPCARASPHRHGRAGERERRDDQCRHARHHRGLRAAADLSGNLRSRNPR